MTRHKRTRPITVGDRLRKGREKLGKTQFEIAIAAGIRPETLSRLEADKSPAALSSLYKLAPVLGIPLDVLIGHQAKQEKAKEKSK